MAYNKQELLELPDSEKLELAEELWDSIDEKFMPITEDDIAFADERLKLHEANPFQGISLEEVHARLKAKYGF